MSGYRPEFLIALQVFAKIREAVEARGFLHPILVGAAAVEFYSGSLIATGDFDVVTARQDVFEAVLQQAGFRRSAGPGHLADG